MLALTLLASELEVAAENLRALAERKSWSFAAGRCRRTINSLLRVMQELV